MEDGCKHCTGGVAISTLYNDRIGMKVDGKSKKIIVEHYNKYGWLITDRIDAEFCPKCGREL